MNQNMFLDINRENSYIPMIYHLEFLCIFAQSIRFLQGNGYICITEIIYKSLIINSFARSMTDVSIEARYICVVAIES